MSGEETRPARGAARQKGGAPATPAKPLNANEREARDKILALLAKRFADDPKKAFAFFDKNHDDEIDTNELYDMLKEADIGNTFTRSRWTQAIIEKFDVDGDGTISMEELIQHLERLNASKGGKQAPAVSSSRSPSRRSGAAAAGGGADAGSSRRRRKQRK